MIAARRDGFTLVEMLVAMLIFALIAAAGTAMLTTTADARSTVRDASDRLAEFQRARALIRDDLGQAAARRVRNPDGSAAAQAFSGSSSPGEALLLLSRAGWSNHGDHPRASIQLVEYRLVDGRLERRHFARLDGGRPEPTQVLLPKVRSARVVFLSQGRETPDWSGTPTVPLPDAIRLDLDLADYGRVSQLFLVGGGGA